MPKYKFDLGKTLVDPFQKFGSSFMMVIGTLKLLFTPKSGVGFDDLSGFVGIYSATQSIALTGFYRLLLDGDIKRQCWYFKFITNPSFRWWSLNILRI